MILYLMTLYFMTLYLVLLLQAASHDFVSYDSVSHDSASYDSTSHDCISWLCNPSPLRPTFILLHPLPSSSLYASYNFFPFSFPTPLRSCFLCVYAHSLLQSINSVWFLFTLSWTCPVIWPYSSVTWLDSTYSHHISGSVSLFYPRCLFLMRCKVKEKFLLKFV